MIIIDTKQMFYHTVSKLTKNYPGLPVQAKSVRPVIIGLICEYIGHFSDTFGELVLAVDSAKPPWRAEHNEFYRYRRKKRAKSNTNNTAVVGSIYKTIMAEIDKYLPVTVINVDHAEADDVIGAMILQNPGEKHLVVSIDHDMEQLLAQKGVSVFRPSSYDPDDILHGIIFNSPVRLEGHSRIDYQFVDSEAAEKIRIDHILRGDQGDDICNVLSPPSSFHDDVRQVVMSSKRYAKLLEELDTGFTDPMVTRRFEENRLMVDMNYIPQEYVEQILAKYEESRFREVVGFPPYIEDFNILRFSHMKNFFDG